MIGKAMVLYPRTTTWRSPEAACHVVVDQAYRHGAFTDG